MGLASAEAGRRTRKHHPIGSNASRYECTALESRHVHGALRLSGGLTPSPGCISFTPGCAQRLLCSCMCARQASRNSAPPCAASLYEGALGV